MFPRRVLIYCFFIAQLSITVIGQSLNQPRFCPSVSWNPNATTFANSTTIGANISGLFIDRNNTLYLPSQTRRLIQIWFEGNTTIARTIPFNRSSLAGLFVMLNGDLYIHVGQPSGSIERYSLNNTNALNVMNVNGVCFGLFITSNSSLYCSLGFLGNRVIRTSLMNTSVFDVVAGNGTAGPMINTLANPYGIFVDKDFGLYVADFGNNRIQFFAPGQVNGTTVAGNGASGNITLFRPNFITLDGNGYLYILDYGNNRLIGSGPNGFRCIAACNVGMGSAMNQLSLPANFAFDSYGNIFVSDMGNGRIQQFLLATNSCEQTTTSISSSQTTSVSSTTSMTTADINTSISTVPDNISGQITSQESTLASTILAQNTSMPTAPSNSTEPISSQQSTVAGTMTDQNSSVTTVPSNSTELVTSYPSTVASTVADQNTSMLLVPHNNTGETTSLPATVTSIIFPQNTSISMAPTTSTGQITSQTPTMTSAIADQNSSVSVVSYNSTEHVTLHQSTSEGNTTFMPSVMTTSQTGLESTINFTAETTVGTKSSTIVSAQAQINSVTSLLSSSITTTPMLSNTITGSLSSLPNNCSTPSLTLIPYGGYLQSPIQYRRDQDIFITSDVRFNCNVSVDRSIAWIVKSCSPTCSLLMPMDPMIQKSSSEIFIPAKTLPLGIYELTYTLTVSNISSSTMTYFQIIPAEVVVHLLPFGTSSVTHDYQQDLTLDPGLYSYYLDHQPFNASDWKYVYFCRIYDQADFPNILGVRLLIDDPRVDPLNPSCLSHTTNNQSALQYGGTSNTSRSSMTIFATALSPNRTYQFMVSLENYQNSSMQIIGDVLVHIQQGSIPTILIGCIISSMCRSSFEFQYVNPTTQVALFSLCQGNCSSLINITWSIYQGTNRSSTGIQWTVLNQTHRYNNQWLFGQSTSNVTSLPQLFLNYPSIEYWKFEVTYLFSSGISSSSLNFQINQPPRNGSCSISPINGTTTTPFIISCPYWYDEDGIKDYSVYANGTIVAFSVLSNLTACFSTDQENGTSVNLIVRIRDQMDSVTDYNLSSILIEPDLVILNEFIDSVMNSSVNPFDNILNSGNQNQISQVIASLAQQFNRIDRLFTESLDVNNSISPLTMADFSSAFPNESIEAEFHRTKNLYSNLREYLINFTSNLTIAHVPSIQLQASALSYLTQSTNQSTRTTASKAADKCSQLAQALHQRYEEISVEDATNSAEPILRCFSNVFTAVSAPIEQRAIPLDLDFTRANAFPDDYETDLELDWSNPNLFADGNDFSWSTIARHRNLYYQKQLAQQIDDRMRAITDLLTKTLNIHLNSGQNITMNSSSLVMVLGRLSLKSLSNRTFEEIRFPTNSIDETPITYRLIVQPLAASDRIRSDFPTNLSRSLSFSMFDRDLNELPFHTNRSSPIELLIPRDPNLRPSSMFLQNVTEMNETKQFFNLHFVNLTSDYLMSLHFEMKPTNENLSYLLIFAFDRNPQWNSSMDGWTLFCGSANRSFYEYFIDASQIENHRFVVFGIREWTNDCRDPSSLNITQPFRFTSNYYIRLFRSSCFYLDENRQWKSDGLWTSTSTNFHRTRCFSTHLTTFAGGFLVLPAPINWNNVFANADFLRNKTIYLTVIVVVLLYILLIPFARYNDRKDLEKLTIHVLSDNDSQDRYFYQILVLTGHRRNAGTKSQIQLIISGDDDETKIRSLSNSNRSICQRGNLDGFLMAVPKSLGSLNYIRIWHDNSGRGDSASWFLKSIVIRDLQTMTKSYFICQRWFAVDKDDGRIERLLPVAGEYQKHQLSYLISKEMYQKISNDHLWFSIFSRPISSGFTRVQRCTCCFVLFLTSMLFNILYYDQSKETTNPSTSISIGPLLITAEQIGIGVIVEFLSFVPSLMLVEFFRRIRSNRSTSTKRTFPHWCLFIAYGCSFLIASVSLFFIIVRGIEFGDVKSQKWLTSILVSFFSSILFVQPIKIVSLMIFFICFIRKNEADDDPFVVDLQHSSSKTDIPSTPSARRLNADELKLVHDERRRQKRITAMLREIFIGFSFVFCFNIVVQSQFQSNGFHQVNHLDRYLGKEFLKIQTIGQFWFWLENEFVGKIRAQSWYNNDPPRNLTGFLDDKTNRLIGWVTMRQLRVKTQMCQWNFTCKNDYSLFDEEKRSFRAGWISETNRTSNSTIDRAFQYRSGNELDSYWIIGQHQTYGTGGYVYEFRGRLKQLRTNLSTLHRFNWIDDRTRAVILQTNLYNPNVNHFVAITLLTEFLPTGGLHPQIRIEPFALQMSISIFPLICLICAMLLIVYLIIVAIRSIRRYFFCFWSYIDIGLIICACSALAMLLWKNQERKRIAQLFTSTNGYFYINFQRAVYIDDLDRFFLSFCCFFANLRCLRLCRLHRRLSFFSQTIRYVSRELFLFSLMFTIVFVAFLSLFYFLFIAHIVTCSTLLHTAQMLFEMTLMKFDTQPMIKVHPVLGPLAFCLFVLLVVFVCMSMFITIISEGFRYIRDHPDQYKTDGEERIFIDILKQFKSC